jgi:hypothetical protein
MTEASSSSSITRRFFCPGEEAQRLQKIGTSNTALRDVTGARVRAEHQVRSTPSAFITGCGAGRREYKKLKLSLHIGSRTDTPEHACRKFLFATGTTGAALASDRCTDRPLASSFFFPFLFSQCYPPPRVSKSMRGVFLTSNVLQDPRGIIVAT